VGSYPAPVTHFSSASFSDFLASTAAKTPTPGGGAVASAVGALAAALAQMVVAYSVGKKNLAAHEADLVGAVKVLENARAMLMRLADEDAQAYGAVNELSKLPEGDPRRAELPSAVRASVDVPLAVGAAAADLLRHFERLAGITNRHLRSDLAIAAVLADATVRATRWNVLVNINALPNASDRTLAAQVMQQMVIDSARRRDAVEAACV
jgi:formiminotetrahydrofolate cyclodeaminase